MEEIDPSSAQEASEPTETLAADPVNESSEIAEPTEIPVRAQPPAFLWVALLLVAFALGLGAGYMIWERPLSARALSAEQKVAALEKTTTADQTAADQNAVPQQVKRYDVPIANNPIYGSSSAPITIIEFSDYECPFCRQWHQEVWPQLKMKYGDKIRLVYRDFPLDSIHPDAVPAAEAADCAGEQKKYFEYGDLLFSGEKALGADTYTAYAQQLNLDLTAFKKCVAERRYQSEVQTDYQYASQLGVRSTPTFFINGLAVVGAQPLEVFQQVIDLELSGKIPK